MSNRPQPLITSATLVRETGVTRQRISQLIQEKVITDCRKVSDRMWCFGPKAIRQARSRNRKAGPRVGRGK
jgi:hypothetical protein